MTCRCGHAEAAHVWSSVHLPDSVVHVNGGNVCFCGCPEYRELETPDSQTLRGTEAS